MARRKRLHPSVYRAINRAVTPKFDRWAKRTYGIDGRTLLAKVAAGEGGGTTRNPNTSTAGAKGPFQFIPSTRRDYIEKYRIDPWRSDFDAARGAIVHLMGTGLKGYNPGMPSYTKYVLDQDVDTSPLGGGGGEGGGGSGGGIPIPTATTVTEFDKQGFAKAQKLQRLSLFLARPDRDFLGELGGKRPKSPLAGIGVGGASSPLFKAGVLSTEAPDPKSFTRTRTETGEQMIDGDGGGGGKLTAGGGFAGTEKLIRGIPTFGLGVSSEKRPTRNTSSGNVSDHYVGNKTGFARDLSGGKAQMDRAFGKLQRHFGRKLRYNQINNFNVKVRGATYRIQVIYGPAVDHDDHIHVGARKL